MKKIIYILLGIMLFGACSEDFLNKESTAQISAEKAFKNAKTIEAIRVGMYAELAYKENGALYTMNLPLANEFSGKDIVYGNQWDLRWGDIYSYKVIPRSTPPILLWEQLFYAAEITNTIITELGKQNDLKLDNAKSLKAEALAIRGMVHVDIARFFGKAYHLDKGASKSIPYVADLQYDASNPGEIKKPFRNTMKEIYEFAIRDITEAMPNLLDLKGNENVMNKNAAHAILARIYLDMHDYSKAKEHAEKAMDGVTLMTGEQYLNGDLSRVNNESILCFSSDKNKYSKWRTITSFYDNYEGMGDDFLVSTSLVSQFSDKDLRKKFFVVEYAGKYRYWLDFETNPQLGFRYASKLNSRGVYACGKMPRKDSNLKNGTRGTLGLGEYNYIRGSEMILIIAECEAHLGNDANAQEKLLEIQKRSIKEAKKSTNTGETLLSEILLERRKELFGEGHSYRDVLRLGKGLKRDGSHYEKIDIEAGDESFVWPLPKTATDRNPNLLK